MPLARAVEETTETFSVGADVAEAGGFVARFGLDPWLLLAQVVNFLLVLLVLTKFVFRPVLQTMRERRGKIARGIEDAVVARRRLEEALAEKRQVLEAANADAAARLRQTEEEAHRLRERVIRTAEEEAAAMHDRAEQDVLRIQEDALRTVTADAGDLVVDALEHVLAERLTPRARTRYRSAALRSLAERAK